MNHAHIRVLLLEDNPGDADRVSLALKKANGNYVVEWATRLSDAVQQLEERDFDVVLADLTLPDCHGLQAVTRLRDEVPDMPVVVLTSISNDKVAIESLSQGAQDYLVKDDFTADTLERSIRYAIHRGQLRSQTEALLEEVQQSKKLLEKKNRHLARLYKMAQRFVDNVSHEFRTPLTVIKEYAALMRERIVGPTNDEQDRMLAVVEDRADDLNIMVDDMLDVSKLEAGMLAVRRTPCAVADIVHHIHVGMERKAEVKGVSLEVAVGEDLPTVYCDFEKAGRIIVNLVVNAIKFCRDPGIVRLWAEEDPDAGEVIVGVTDNGPGIDDAKQAELFRRFKQLGNQERGSTKGFGLGLNIARELVDLNFGRMRVESELGKGSTFSFSLPVADPTSVMDRYLARIAHVENGGAMTSLIAVDVEGPLDPSVSDEIDDFLAHVLRKNDLVFRADEAGWLLVVPVEGHDLAAFLTRAEKLREEANRNRPQGKIPDIRLNTLGTWRVGEERDEILACVEQTVHALESACV